MLKIRLSRVGRKKQPFFKIVVIPKRGPSKGGKFRDEVGTHDPVNKETTINEEKVRAWMAKGAQPSDTVYNLLVKNNIIVGRKKKVHDKDPVEPEPKKVEENKEEKEKEEPKKVEENKEEESKTEEKTSDSDLKSLDFTSRIINALEDAGVDSLEKLKKKSEEDLSEIKGLGKKSIEKIMDELK